MIGRAPGTPRHGPAALRRLPGGRRLVVLLSTSLLIGGLVGDVSSARAQEGPSAGWRETKRDVKSEAGIEAPRTALDRWRDASPAKRREMRRALRERIENASPRERRRIERRFRRLRQALPDFSPIERMILLRAAAELPEAERESLRRRVARIDDMDVVERRTFTSELKALIEGYSGEVDRLERNKERWEQLSEADRREYRAQMERLRAMSLEERRALLEEMEKRGQPQPQTDQGDSPRDRR